MGLSFSTETGDGITTVFPFTLAGLDKGYFRDEDVYAYTRASQDEDWVLDENVTIVSNNSLQFDTAPVTPTDGEPNILIRRQMPQEQPYSDFTRGNSFGKANMNNSFLQQLYLMQEVLDGFRATGFAYREDQDLDGNKIINSADPEDPQDLSTKAYVDAEVIGVDVAQAAAEAAQADAELARDAAQSSEDDSAAYALASASSASLSSGSATDAEDSNLEAESWANSGEDVPVQEFTAGVGTDRVPSVFSAKHYWAKVVGLFATIVAKTSSIGSAIIPSGTTAERDSAPQAGHFRFNSDLTSFEGYNGSEWGSVGGGATGGGANAVFHENDTNVTEDYTITTGKNAMSAGPITVDTGVTVKVPTGSVWTVV